MACKTAKMMQKIGSACTLGSTATAAFVPYFRFQAGQVDGVRLSFDLEAKNDVSVTRAKRTSNDGVTWGNPTTIGSAVTSTGWDWGSSFDTPDVSAQWVEYGFSVKNVAGSTSEFAQITARADVRYV